MLQSTFSSVDTRRSWVVAVAALLIMGVAFGAPWITLVALKDIAAEVRGERSIPAFASALMWIGSGVGGILMGRIAERIGIRFTVIFGSLMVALGLALSSFGPSLPLYIGHRLFMGLLGIGGINAPFYVYVSRWFDRRRGSALALFATSLNFLVGYGGMVSFGHGMFYGLGAYSFALLMQRTGMPIPAAFVLALAMCAALGLVVGAICVRLKEIYFAFLTLAFQMLVHSVIILWVPLTGGDQGLRGGIPRREIFGFELASQLHLYQFCAIVAVLGLLALRHITTSPFGQTLRMIRDNENRASFLGIVLWRARLWAFTIAGGFAGLGGVLAALFVSGAYPELADWPNSGQAIFAVLLGGINSFLGPVLGAAILLALNDIVSRVTEYHGLVLGLVILAAALGLRRGVLDFLKLALPGRAK